MVTATATVETPNRISRSTEAAILPNLIDEKPSKRWRSVVEEAGKLSAKRSKKAALLLDAARQFNKLHRPSRTDISLFKELFYQLVEGCEADQRKKLSSIMARSAYLPRQIAVFLAIDAYDVAAPVLLFSPVLNEADLTLLAARLPDKHRAVVCRREALTPASVRALVRHGGMQCRTQLEKNPAVLKSPKLFEAMSGQPPASIEETVREENGPEAVANEPATAETVEIAGASVEIPPPPDTSLEQNVREELVSLAGKGGRLGSKSTPQHDAVREGATSESGKQRIVPLHRRLLGPARKRNFAALAAVISSHCGLPADTTRGLLTHGGTDNVIVLFKGLGIDVQNAMQLLLLMDAETLSANGTYDRVRNAYRKVDSCECRQFLNSLGAKLTADNPAPMREEAPRPSLALIAERRRQSLAELSRPATDHTERSELLPNDAIPLAQIG